jgi:putative effector of murein hydrolase LrgA (UPF0299 family)
MAENSDYENRKEREDVLGAFVIVSYVVLWPIYFFLIVKVDWLTETLPAWASVLGFMFSPMVVALLLNRWNTRLERN